MAVAAPSPPGSIVRALRAAADEVERRLAQSSGLHPSQVAILMHLADNQPQTIPEVAGALGHHYRWAQAGLADLRGSGWAIRLPSNPARFALTDAGTALGEEMSATVQQSIVSAQGWPAAEIAWAVVNRLSHPTDDTRRIVVTAPAATLSDFALAALCLGVEPQVIEAWVRSRSLPPPPWTEEHLSTMTGLRGSVAAVWPVLLEGARSNRQFSDVANSVGLTTQKVASAISRDPHLRAQLDDALMQGRDQGIYHGRRSAYRRGCWCPECRSAQPPR
jgi:DNA-binding MarR family transcriptional regulator